MRRDVEDPFSDEPRLTATIDLAHTLYRLHEAGKDYSRELSALGQQVNQTISKFDVDAAFGAINAETFARRLLSSKTAIPTDLSHAEMLELVERVCNGDGDEFQIGYWVQCLEVNTGDDRISDLIYWPGEYFEDGDNSREMTSSEILKTALTNGKGDHG